MGGTVSHNATFTAHDDGTMSMTHLDGVPFEASEFPHDNPKTAIGQNMGKNGNTGARAMFAKEYDKQMTSFYGGRSAK